MDSSERRSSTFIDLLGFLSLHVACSTFIIYLCVSFLIYDYEWHQKGCQWLLNNNRPWNRMLESNQPPHLHNRPTQFFFKLKKQRCVYWVVPAMYFTLLLSLTDVFSIFSPCSLWWETKDGEHECICKSIVSFTFMGEIKVEVSLTAVVQDSMKRISSNRRAAKRLQKRFCKWS